MGGVSVWQLVIILVIVLLIFGTKKFKNLGSDLGSAVKGFKSAMSDSEQSAENKTTETLANKSNSSPIDAEVLKDVMKDPMKKEEQKKEGSKKDV